MNFIDIAQRLANIIEINTGTPPLDKQIAYVLGLSATQFSNYKKRNKIPFAQIALFCEEYEITINWVLFGQSSMKLIEKEEEIYKVRIVEKINKQ